MWAEEGEEGREDAKLGELGGEWLVCFSSEGGSIGVRVGWREDDEVGVGCFEFEVYWEHPSRDAQPVRGLCRRP